MLAVAAVIVVLVVALALLLARQRARWLAECRAGAAKIHGETSEMYRGEHTYRIATEADFANLEKSGYRRVREALVARGFRHLGTYENVTVARVHPDHRTFIDSYVGADGVVGADTYRVQDLQAVDFSSVLEDGRFLVTTNVELDTLTPPPAVMKCTLPSDTPIDALLARHLERLAALRTAEPMVRFHIPTSLDDVLAVARRHSRLVSDYRRQLGLITEQEMLGFATGPGQERTAKQIWKEFQKLRDGAGE